MRVLVAPAAFKGTMSPATVAAAIAKGIGQASDPGMPAARRQGFERFDGSVSNPASGRTSGGCVVEPVLMPLADGGDGTVEAVHLAAGGTIRQARVLAHGCDKLDASWLELGDQALVELASACGIARLPGSLRPMEANTAGLGQVLRHVMDLGFSNISVAVGGSASTDGGAGALKELGAVFLDGKGQVLETLNGATLGLVADCDLSALEVVSQGCTLRVLTDVENPLLGPTGAAAVFAPQKGANKRQVSELESGLHQFSAVLQKKSGRQLCDAPGAGAAGGTAFGLACGLGASIESGFGWVSKVCGLKDKLAACSLVITGEGRLDSQSVNGKVIGELVKVCEAAGKPLWVVAGCVEDGLTVRGIERIIIPRRTQGMCTAADIAREFKQIFSLHNFSTSET